MGKGDKGFQLQCIVAGGVRAVLDVLIGCGQHGQRFFGAVRVQQNQSPLPAPCKSVIPGLAIRFEINSKLSKKLSGIVPLVQSNQGAGGSFGGTGSLQTVRRETTGIHVLYRTDHRQKRIIHAALLEEYLGQRD